MNGTVLINLATGMEDGERAAGDDTTVFGSER